MIFTKLGKNCITLARNITMGDNKGIELTKIVLYLNKFAPLTLSETWDNTGLLVEPQVHVPVCNVLLTNDLTEDVTQEAISLNTQLIISYHPPIFRPLKSITTTTWKERVIGTCVENKMAVYSPHTSWDSVNGGVNDWLASAFDFSSNVPLIPNKEDSTTGAGRLVTLKSSVTLKEAVENVKKLTGLPHLKLAVGRLTDLNGKIESVSICAGSGASVLSKSVSNLYLTGEMSHHELLDATHSNISVILCNHSDSERGFLKHFAENLREEFNGINVNVSKTDKDPLITV